MRKRLFSVLLAFSLLLGSALPVFAVGQTAAEPETTPPDLTISTAAELIAFAEDCRLDRYSVGLTVALQNDIDLTDAEFFSIPTFSGTFLGNGHTISGLSITADGSSQGLFRYLTADALVQNLKVQGSVQPAGSRGQVGGIAGSNAGTLRDCSFSGTVTGGERVGGIAGINTVTGVIENCAVSGAVSGDHFTGGIAGENAGVIRSCENRALINITPQQNSVDLSDITLDTLTNSEAADTVTDVGGIAGLSSGVIRSCSNHAQVGYRHMGYNVGGIAGTQSGYLADCTNTASVYGRKEVGGIVGQLEPAARVEYSTDTLQILRDQLRTLSRLADRAAGNAKTNAGQITVQIALLQEQILTARTALESMVPGNGELDVDTVLAAQATALSALAAMPGTLNSIAAAAGGTVTTLTQDLDAIAQQIDRMEATLSNASQNLGGSLRDVSDEDTAEELTGKVERCINTGAVLADLNVGGIVGAMAIENDLDVLEDWSVSGESSLNFESELRAVVLECENSGTVTAQKQNAGGIAGWQSMGLVRRCANTGILDAAAAKYVGGITGQSTGYLRSCQAQCRIAGAEYVGGIAGSAAVVSDCRSMVQLTDAAERFGAVLGVAADSDAEQEQPITGNYYLSVAQDIGAVDGISYAGAAEPLEQDTFLALPDLHEMFKTVTLTFRCEDGTEYRLNAEPGGAVDASAIPAVPPKAGFLGRWDGLEAVDLNRVLFNASFSAVYTARATVLVSDVVGTNGLPMLLVQGDFGTDAAVQLSDANTVSLLLAKGDTLLAGWSVTLPEPENAVAARLQLPPQLRADEAKLLVQNADGSWAERAFTVDESYLVFDWSSTDVQLALVQCRSFPLWLAAAIAAGVVLVIAVATVRRRRVKNTKV